MSIRRVVCLCLMLIAVEATADQSKRYVCANKNGERHFTETYGKGCNEIQLEHGWKNFDVLPSAIIDIKPGNIISEPDGKTIWMRFYLAEIADDVNGKWQYDHVESLHKFYCGKRETRLIKGTYKLRGKTVYVRSSRESVMESVDPRTVNDAIYRSLCEDDQ